MVVDQARSERMAAAMRAARTLSGHSQEAVASKIGVDLKTIQRIESGKRHNPNLETVHKLADLYGQSVDVLTGRKVIPQVDPADTIAGLKAHLDAALDQMAGKIAGEIALVSGNLTQLARMLEKREADRSAPVKKPPPRQTR
jgi:transcriptional regulator with XRE-family HTH domain